MKNAPSIEWVRDATPPDLIMGTALRDPAERAGWLSFFVASPFHLRAIKGDR